MKYWKLPEADRRLTSVLANECGISEFVAEILVNRGITTYAQAESFLNEDAGLEDPFVLADMEKAVERVRLAVDSYEKIVIYGDYDCDGVTSTVLLYSYLSSLGANVSYYIPGREGEGYGLNRNAVAALAEEKVSLMITVDNGISAVEEIEYANSLGLTVIVTDHHQVGAVLPPAYAVVNPHRADCPSTFKHLAGVGVAFKLVTAMEQGDYAYTLEQFADLLAIGTVADIVPLVDENRTIVKLGLEAIRNTDNMGLAALMQAANINPEKLSSQSVAFGIAPRINAAGRMEHAGLAAELLLSDDSEQAQELAERVNALNVKRREQEDGILSDIREMIRQDGRILYDRVLTFYHEGWHPGIIGIVSSKVLETYGKPNLLMSLENEELRGSARSVEFFSLYKALTACEKHLSQYGGHTQAAGFSLKLSDYPAMKQSLEDYAAEHHKVMPGFAYTIDKEVFPAELSIENIKSLTALEPFGASNQQPLFLIRKAKLKQVSPVSENKHIRLKLAFGGMEITAMYFGMSTDRFLYQQGQELDMVCQISMNYYNGREYLSISVRDIRLSRFEQQKFFNAKAYYEMFRRGEPLSTAVISKSTPNRNDTAVVYKYLQKHQGYQGDLEMLYSVFAAGGMNYMKYRLILDVLSDVGLIEVSPLLDSITMKTPEGKVDLQTAGTFAKLKQGQAT